MEDISSLIGQPVISLSSVEASSGGESMTGGVGTTFYRAPEQEGRSSNLKRGDGRAYTVQADIFSFGIILFEVFHPPFQTYMERAEALTILRGERESVQKASSLTSDRDFKERSLERFPPSFIQSVPDNAQRYVRSPDSHSID